jgi:ABC-2 type transport system ATP-binding protein
VSPVAELIAVRKSYGAVEALKGVDLRIHPGEVMAILGPNGAGKTTLISVLLGLRKPTAGQVRLFGLNPTDRRARSRCGVMLQESGVTAVLTVTELVNLFRAYYPSPLPTDHALRVAGLQDKATSTVSSLSGGQRQRLYFALAICGDAEVLFLDEPTVGMDVQARRAFLSTIHDFTATGKTIVLTTHYLEDADTLAKRIVVIDRGIVIADAAPQAIKARVAGRRIRFTADRRLTADTFDGLPVQRVELHGQHVNLLSNEPETVLRELFERGITISDLEVGGADLEEAVISLTDPRWTAP